MPFVKNDESDLSEIKLTYFNTTEKKKKKKEEEDFVVYDYYKHLKKFGFTWEHKAIGIKYGIRISNSDNKKLKNNLP